MLFKAEKAQGIMHEDIGIQHKQAFHTACFRTLGFSLGTWCALPVVGGRGGSPGLAGRCGDRLSQERGHGNGDGGFGRLYRLDLDNCGDVP